MSAISAIAWGILAFVIIFITAKYYLPVIICKYTTSTSELPSSENVEEEVTDAKVSSSVDETEEKEDTITIKNPLKLANIFNSINRKSISLCIFAIAFSACCGYFACVRTVTWLDYLKICVAFFVLLVIFVTDLEVMKIPNLCCAVLASAGAIVIGLQFIFFRDTALKWMENCLLAVVVCFVFLIVMSRLTRGGLGMGDVKILTAQALMCGFLSVLFTLFFAFVICSICSAVLLVLKKKGLKDSLPLGPFIWIAFGLSVILGVI